MDDRPYISWDEGSDRLVVCLPHQCDERTIGGPEDVLVMIEALQGLLPEFHRPEAFRHPHSCPRCGVVVYKAGARCRKHECSARVVNWVCSACFYPAQEERRKECQTNLHPEQPCEMPWCLWCGRCRRGCAGGHADTRRPVPVPDRA